MRQETRKGGYGRKRGGGGGYEMVSVRVSVWREGEGQGQGSIYQGYSGIEHDGSTESRQHSFTEHIHQST